MHNCNIDGFIKACMNTTVSRTPTIPFVPAPTPAKSKMSGGPSQLSSRRSRQARLRAMKMRRLYGNEQQVCRS